MTTSDLIWRLIEILLQDKEKKSDANDQKKDQKQSIGVYATTLLFFAQKNELNVATHLVRLSIMTTSFNLS